MKTRLLLPLALLATFLVEAQESVSAFGGDALGTGGSSSYTLGQVFYTTNLGSGGAVIQGVQQSVELFTFSNLALTTVTLTTITYPNPTAHYIILKITDSALDSLRYNLFDMQGRIVLKNKATQTHTEIDLKKI